MSLVKLDVMGDLYTLQLSDDKASGKCTLLIIRNARLFYKNQ